MLPAHPTVGMLVVQMQYTSQLFAREGLAEQKCLQLPTKH